MWCRKAEILWKDLGMCKEMSLSFLFLLIFLIKRKNKSVIIFCSFFVTSNPSYNLCGFFTAFTFLLTEFSIFALQMHGRVGGWTLNTNPTMASLNFLLEASMVMQRKTKVNKPSCRGFEVKTCHIHSVTLVSLLNIHNSFGIFDLRFANQPRCPLLCYLCKIWALQQWGQKLGDPVHCETRAEDWLWRRLCQNLPLWPQTDWNAWRLAVLHHVWWVPILHCPVFLCVLQTNQRGNHFFIISSGPDICGYSTKKVHVIFNYKGKNHLIKKEIKCKVSSCLYTPLFKYWSTVGIVNIILCYFFVPGRRADPPLHVDPEPRPDLWGKDRQREGGIRLSGGGLGLPASKEDQGPWSQEARGLGWSCQDWWRDWHQAWGITRHCIQLNELLSVYTMLFGVGMLTNHSDRINRSIKKFRWCRIDVSNKLYKIFFIWLTAVNEYINV